MSRAGQPMAVKLADLASGKVPESIKRAGAQHGPDPPFLWRADQRARALANGRTRRTAARSQPAPRCSARTRSRAIIRRRSISRSARARTSWRAMNLADGGRAPLGREPRPLERGAGRDGLCAGPVRRHRGRRHDHVEQRQDRRLRQPRLSRRRATPRKRSRPATRWRPSTTQCLIPAEVARAVPMGMVMSVAYGPEVHFAEAPKNPKWAVTVRYKSNGSLMRGMAGMMGGSARTRSFVPLLEEVARPAPALRCAHPLLRISLEN